MIHQFKDFDPALRFQHSLDFLDRVFVGLCREPHNQESLEHEIKRRILKRKTLGGIDDMELNVRGEVGGDENVCHIDADEPGLWIQQSHILQHGM